MPKFTPTRVSVSPSALATDGSTPSSTGGAYANATPLVTAPSTLIERTMPLPTALGTRTRTLVPLKVTLQAGALHRTGLHRHDGQALRGLHRSHPNGGDFLRLGAKEMVCFRNLLRGFPTGVELAHPGNVHRDTLHCKKHWYFQNLLTAQFSNPGAWAKSKCCL